MPVNPRPQEEPIPPPAPPLPPAVAAPQPPPVGRPGDGPILQMRAEPAPALPLRDPGAPLPVPPPPVLQPIGRPPAQRAPHNQARDMARALIEIHAAAAAVAADGNDRLGDIAGDRRGPRILVFGRDPNRRPLVID